jgi:hypothetical protein
MQQKGNRTYLTAFGETKGITEWTRDPRCVVKDVTTLSSRVRNAGMDDHTAITLPIGANLPTPLKLTYQGETKTLAEWVKDPRCTVKITSTLQSRIQKGWSDEKVLTEPVKKSGPSRHKLKITAWGETKTVAEWAKDKRCKVDAASLYRRLRRTEYSPEQVMSTPPGRLTEIVTAWGDSMTPVQWEADPRCLVSASTLRLRLRSGMSPEEALRTPSLRADEMTSEQRFDAELSAMAALRKKDKKERFTLLDRALLEEAAAAVKGDVQFSNRYMFDKRFCMGIWAEPVTMLDLAAELTHLAESDERYRGAPVRRFLASLSKRQSQGGGDLYLFGGWFCGDEHGEVWRG